MVIALFLLILPPTRRSTPLLALIASSPVLVLGSNTNLSMVSWAFGPDRQRRAVEEDEMRTVVGVGGDQLVGLHVDADAQHALGLGRRLAKRIAVGGRRDADLGGSIADGERSAEECQCRRAKQRGAHERSPHKHRFCHGSLLRGRHGGQPRHQPTPRYQRYWSRTRWVQTLPQQSIVPSEESTTNDVSTKMSFCWRRGDGSPIGTNSCNSATSAWLKWHYPVPIRR